MKTGKALLLAIVMLFAVAIARPAAAQMGGFDVVSIIKDILSPAIPPYIGAVTIDPEEPAAGEAVTVTASITTLALFEDEAVTSVDEAFLYYSTDGGDSWEEVEMEEDGDNLWVGEIEGQDSGAEVLYYLRAVSDVGDMDFEIAGKDITIDYGVSQAIELHSALNKGNDFENLQTIIEDKDDAVSPDPQVNFETVAMGSDDDNLYIRINTEDEMDGGKMSPLNANAYISLFIDFDPDGDEFDANEMSAEDFVDASIRSFIPENIDSISPELAARLSAWTWVPIAKSVGSMIGGLPVETILRFDPAANQPVYYKDQVSSERDGGAADLTISKEAIGTDTQNLIMIMVDINLTGQIPDSITGMVPDVAFPTLIKFVDHSYTVGD
jgi:hypothetical protein